MSDFNVLLQLPLYPVRAYLPPLHLSLHSLLLQADAEGFCAFRDWSPTIF